VIGDDDDMIDEAKGLYYKQSILEHNTKEGECQNKFHQFLEIDEVELDKENTKTAKMKLV
jgi:hypothetical protein